MSGVCNDCSILHRFEVASNDDVFHSGCGAEDVANLCSFIHGHDSIPFHDSTKCRERVDFCDDDVRTHAAGSHCNTAAAVSETCNDEGFASKKDRCSPKDTINGRLPCAVDIVEVPLGHSVVHCNHRIAKVTSSAHCSQAVNTRCCLFCSANHALCVF